MAFPASQPLPYEALSTARRTLAGLRTTVSDLRTESVSADIPRTRVVGLMGLLAGAIDRLTAAAAVSGIGQYAKDQYADQNLDVVADFDRRIGPWRIPYCSRASPLPPTPNPLRAERQRAVDLQQLPDRCRVWRLARDFL